MMKEEVKRIMKLVQEGKLSPEDAAELIEAFDGSPAADDTDEQHESSSTPPPPPDAEEAEPTGAPKPSDPFAHLIESIEKLGKDVAKSVNWRDVADQLRTGTQKGLDVVKNAADQIRQGKGFAIFGVGETREISLPLSVAPGKTLRVENPSGDVRVTGSSGAGSVKAVAVIRGYSLDEARAKAEQYTLVLEESDQFVLIRQPDMSGLSVDLDIQVQAAVNVEIRSSAGDVSITDTKGGCRISGKSGDIRLVGVDGVIEVATSSGDVTIMSAACPSLTIENKSGDVHVEKVTGNFNIRSAAGDIKLRDCSGKAVAVEAVSGDVEVDLNQPVDGTVNVRTVSGDARVLIPDGSNCRVALSTLRGAVSSGLELADEAKQEQRITGRLGEGQGSIDVSAINGDIRLGQHDSVMA